MVDLTRARLYSLFLADVVQVGQVVRNSLAHDLRLAGFLREHPLDERSDYDSVQPMLKDLLARLDHQGIEPTNRARLDWQAGAVDSLNDFILARSQAGDVIRDVVIRGGNLHLHLRTLADAAPPDMTMHWSRWETSDSLAAESIYALTTHFSMSLRDTINNVCPGVGSIAVERSLDFSWLASIHARNDFVPTLDAPHAVHHFLNVPYWILLLPRLSVLVAHEVAHPWAALLRRQHPRVAQAFLAVREVMELICAHFALTDAQRLRGWQDQCELLLDELMGDILAVLVGGPAVVISLASFFVGSSKKDDPRDRRVVAPLSVRLRTALYTCHLATPTTDPEVNSLLLAVEAQVDDYCATMRTTPDPLEQGRTRAPYVEFQDKLVEVAVVFASELVDTLSPPEGLWRRSPQVVSITESWANLWQKVQAGEDTLAAAVDAPEGRGLYRAHREMTRRPAKSSVVLGQGPTWDLVHIFLRRSGNEPPPTALREPEGVLDAIGAVVPGQGLAAMVLGPCDVLVLREGAKSRADDGLSRAEVQGFASYLRRRILLEVSSVDVPGGGRVFRTEPLALEQAYPAALTSIRHDPQHPVEALVAGLLCSSAVREGRVRPLRIWTGVGWSQTTWLWSLRDLSGLLDLHREVLTGGGPCGVQRSITQLLTFCRPLGLDAQVVRIPPIATGEAGGLHTVASLRATRAQDIPDLASRLASDSRATVEGVFGLLDLLADMPVTSADSLADETRVLWRLVANADLTRSFTHLAFPLTSSMVPL